MNHSSFSELTDTAPNWSGVTDFAAWVLAAHLPLCPMRGLEVIDTDDAIAFPIFRHGQFQAELYVFTPSTVPPHSHPNVEVIQSLMHPAYGVWSAPKPVLTHPATHGGVDLLPGGLDRGAKYLLMTYQKWADGVPPTTLAAAWKGPLMGPKQEALVKRFFPDAYVTPGYADITRNKAQES